MVCKMTQKFIKTTFNVKTAKKDKYVSKTKKYIIYYISTALIYSYKPKCKQGYTRA